MVTYDRTEDMLNQYCVEHYRILTDIHNWELVIVEHDSYWDVKCYTDEKILDVKITATDVTSWIWFHTMKGK